MLSIQSRKNMRKNNRAISPAISTVIMTAALVVLVFVALSFANSSLTTQLAGDEFNANKQFMQSTGQQIDNVAWTIGRTETVDYTAKYGQVAFEKENLTGGIEKLTEGLDYAIEIYNGNSWQTVFNSTTGVIVFNMPVSDYNIGNNCFSRIIPVDSGSFLQWNASAPVCQIFTRQVAPMNDGSFSRIVAVPTVRALNSTLNTANGNLNCYTFYLPLLNDTSNPYLSQSVTLIGANLTNLNYLTPNGVNNCQVRIDATAIDNTSTGFNNAFFNFPSTSETTSIPSNSMIEIYIGTVDVSIGMAS